MTINSAVIIPEVQYLGERMMRRIEAHTHTHFLIHVNILFKAGQQVKELSFDK